MEQVAKCRYCSNPIPESVAIDYVIETEVGVYSFCSEECMDKFISECKYIHCDKCDVWYYYSYMEHMPDGSYLCGECYEKTTGKKKEYDI